MKPLAIDLTVAESIVVAHALTNYIDSDDMDNVTRCKMTAAAVKLKTAIDSELNRFFSQHEGSK